jgi:hypothetical protein
MLKTPRILNSGKLPNKLASLMWSLNFLLVVLSVTLKYSKDISRFGFFEVDYNMVCFSLQQQTHHIADPKGAKAGCFVSMKLSK